MVFSHFGPKGRFSRRRFDISIFIDDIIITRDSIKDFPRAFVLVCVFVCFPR